MQLLVANVHLNSHLLIYWSVNNSHNGSMQSVVGVFLFIRYAVSGIRWDYNNDVADSSRISHGKHIHNIVLLFTLHIIKYIVLL